MIGAVVSWLAGGGVRAILGELKDAYALKLRAQNDHERLAAEQRIASINAQLAAHREAAEIRRQTAGFWEQRILVFIAGLGPVLHFAAVCLDSTFPALFPGWVVLALPGPMAEWEGWIILSFFGLLAWRRWR